MRKKADVATKRNLWQNERVVNRKYWLKVCLCLLVAFLAARILTQEVFYPEFPVVRPLFKQKLSWTVKNLPATVVSSVKDLARKSYAMPPPWQSRSPFALLPIGGPSSPPYFNRPTEVPRKTTAYPTRPVYVRPTSGQVRPTDYYGGPQPTARPTQQPAMVTPLPTQAVYPTPVPTTPPATNPAQPPSQAAGQLLDLINAERGRQGAGGLSFESHLNVAAQGYAEVMTSCGHTAPDGSDPFERMRRAGYPGGGGGENVACGPAEAQRVFDMWMGSAGHRDNMLEPRWRSAGIGIARGYWVLDLGPL